MEVHSGDTSTRRKTHAEEAVVLMCEIDSLAKKLRDEAAARKEEESGPQQLSVEEALKLAPTRELLLEVGICGILSYVRRDSAGIESIKALASLTRAAERIEKVLSTTSANDEFATRCASVVEEVRS